MEHVCKLFRVRKWKKEKKNVNSDMAFHCFFLFSLSRRVPSVSSLNWFNEPDKVPFDDAFKLTFINVLHREMLVDVIDRSFLS